MNLIILPTSYPNIYNENSAIYVQDQARALAKHEDVEVSVVGAISISFKYIWKKRMLKFGSFKYKKNNVNVVLVLFPSIPKLKRFNNFIRYVLNRRLIRKYSKVSKIDMIHVHNSVAGKAALWYKNKFNIPYLVTEHSSEYSRRVFRSYEMSLYKKIYQNAACNIAVSKEFCKLLSKTFDLSFTYVPNIVDTDFFIPSQKNHGKFKFINIANLNKNKNQLSLIKAFSNAFMDKKNISLVILGGGPEYDTLTHEIEKLDMKEQITLYGSATRMEVLRELQSSNIFILSSKYETFGVVLIEAMSCGLPVVSTKCGGPESIVNDDKLGLLIEKNDVINGLVNAMIKVYNSTYDNEYIRNYCIENFSENAVTVKLNEIYKDIICQKLK